MTCFDTILYNQKLKLILHTIFMVFSSITFLFFFLPFFLAVYLFSGKYKNIILLCTSLLFYTWGEGIYLLVMLSSILVNYICGLFLVPKRKGVQGSRVPLLFGIIFNFGVLAFFKYANFIVDNLNNLLSVISLPIINLTPVHLPIGISFFTFQAASYLVDVYRGTVAPQKSIINLGIFISLFPQLIAGPIVRYHDIASTLVKRTVNPEDFAIGIRRFIWGLSKKVLLANPMALTADKIFTLPLNEVTTPVAWLGALCYTLQIYFDFSGYSDMAIGLGRMLGFQFLENFNYPYISTSIQEFWRRWHISLSRWFRDYLYIPLGGNRKGELRTYVNLLTVFSLCGLWHGASWTFVCWGLFHGGFIILERTKLGQIRERLWLPIQYIITIVIVIVGWVLFRSETITGAFQYIGIMFGITQGATRDMFLLYFDNKLSLEFFVATVLCLPIFSVLVKLRENIEKELNSTAAGIFVVTLIETTNLAAIIGLMYLTVISLAAGAYNPFIYFRF
jgi:alginate O-acetyltransferase complex protein AlgI